jgi:hypothetical protein
MRYIIYVDDRTLQAKSLMEAINKAKTIRNTVGDSVKILDTFSNEYISF